MVGPYKVKFGVAYYYVHRFQGFPCRAFVGLFAYIYVDIYCNIDLRCAFSGKDDYIPIVHRFLEFPVGTLHFMFG